MHCREMGKVWKIHDYGVNDIHDLLDDVPDGNICIHNDGKFVTLSLPAQGKVLQNYILIILGI